MRHCKCWWTVRWYWMHGRENQEEIGQPQSPGQEDALRRDLHWSLGRGRTNHWHHGAWFCLRHQAEKQEEMGQPQSPWQEGASRRDLHSSLGKGRSDHWHQGAWFCVRHQAEKGEPGRDGATAEPRAGGHVGRDLHSSLGRGRSDHWQKGAWFCLRHQAEETSARIPFGPVHGKELAQGHPGTRDSIQPLPHYWHWQWVL
jgi:hypothetical protein